MLGPFQAGDSLVFVKPTDIRESYYYTFCIQDIVLTEDGSEPLPVPDLDEIASFTCYHRYGGYYGIFRPGVDEVLAQIPSDVDITQVHGFEIQVLDPCNMYDGVLDRHVSKVILYKMTPGLPQSMLNQKVICTSKNY